LEPKQRMRGTTREIQYHAKELRKRMTIAERLVWQMLRKHRQRGFYFRRQHPVGRFILDFCCVQAKLCIEAAGYRVIRFRNDEVMEQSQMVYERIQAALEIGACTSLKDRANA
jgi:very-short-patch-repair endonuclease